MSSSRHPIALSVERRVGGPSRLLATVMLLPLVDGIFPALVLAGAVDSVAGILEVGLLVFGGSATVAVILAEMDGSRREQARVILGVGAVLVPVALLEAALAPTITQVLNMDIFGRFAGLVILTVAASTASARIAEFLPRPAVIVGLGLVASVDLSATSLSVAVRPELVLQAGAAAAVGVGFALAVALAGPWLRNAVDIDRFRFGSAVALGVLALSVLGLVPTEAPLALAVLAVTGLLALDPGRAREPEWEYYPDHIDITAALATGDGGIDRDAGGDHDQATAEADGGTEEGQSDWSERLPWM